LRYLRMQILQVNNPHSLPVMSNSGGCWHHQDDWGHQNAGLTGITLTGGREWSNLHCMCISGANSWLLCVLAWLPTSGPALGDVQIRMMVVQTKGAHHIHRISTYFMHIWTWHKHTPQFYCLTFGAELVSGRGVLRCWSTMDGARRQYD